MANNYVMFSLALRDVTDDEWRWLKRQYEKAKKDDLGPGYQMRREQNVLYIFTEESGDLEKVATLLQNYLKEFHPKSGVGFQWAETCDAPRPDNFGGGAVFITAKSQKWWNTVAWLREASERFENRKKKAHG